MNRTVTFIKTNIFTIVVILMYTILIFSYPQISIDGIKNSGYYIKEMLMIMPVIFVLTALFDTWIPKETISKFLGKEAKTKGIFLSFILGSVSAGPIYAAFPFCVMLHKKGATIRNIVIILSSWAVIKVPMLLNEAKFLGLKFMITRWLLTIIAILIFASLMAQLVKDKDISPKIENQNNSIYINTNSCMGCTVCTKKYPELFEMSGKKASLKDFNKIDHELLDATIKSCPVQAIQSHMS